MAGEEASGGPSRWDARWADGDWVDTDRPAAILVDAAPWLPAAGEGRPALDLACGSGRNALHLAERGWRVLAVDLSRTGLARLVARARERGVGGHGRGGVGGRGRGGELGGELGRGGDDSAPAPLPRPGAIQPVRADLARFAVRPGAFDLVVNTHFLLRPLFPLIREALRPGGLLLFETYSVHEIEELGGDIRRAFALERGELQRAFGDFEVLLHEEGVFEREEGERGLARLIARRRGDAR